MLGNLEEMQKAGKMQMDSVSRSAMMMMKGAQRMTAEAADQAKESVERCSKYFERIASAKSVDEALRIQSEFAAANMERFITGATKIAESYASLAKDVTAPAQEAATAATAAVRGAATAAEARMRASG